MAGVTGSELAIVIRAVDMATPTLAAVKGELAGLRSTVAAFNAEVASMTRTVALATTALGVGVTMAAKKAVDAYAEFETSTIELAKKTGLAGAELEELVQVLTYLSTYLPTTRKQMVDLAVEAAKLGIEGTENIAAVVQAALKFQEATSGLVRAEDALTALGKILTAMKLPWTDVEKLGSAIVKLADTSAADVPEILQELQKVAAIGNVVGLTADEVASLVTQIIAFGHVAGRTGLRLSRILQLSVQRIPDFSTILFGTEKTAGLFDKMAAMGKEYEELAEQLKTFPFVEWVNDLKLLNEVIETRPLQYLLEMAKFLAAIPSRALRLEVMTEMFGSMAPYFTPLVEGMEQFDKFLADANRAFQEGTELTRQYELALTTLSTQQKIVGGNFETAIQQIGEGLAPALKRLNEEVLMPFSAQLVEITSRFAELRKAAAETAAESQNWVIQVAKVRLEGIAEAIQAALLEGDYRPMLEELTIAVGGVVLMVQAWKLAAEALVALKAFFKTALGGLIWDIGTCVLTANFVFEMLPESIKKAIDEATDRAAEWVSRLPLPEGLKNAIQGFLDRLGEEKWTTVITLAITWFVAKNAWHLLMQALFGLFSAHGLSAEAGGPAEVVVRGLTHVVHSAVSVVWEVAKTLGASLLEAIRQVLWAAGFSAATGGLAMAGAALMVGLTLGILVYGILKLAQMSTEEFEEAIASETMKAVSRARREAEEAMSRAWAELRARVEEEATLTAEQIAAGAGQALLSAIKTSEETLIRAGEEWKRLSYETIQARTTAGMEAARYLAMSMARAKEEAFEAERMFAAWAADIVRAAEKGDDLVAIFGTIFRTLKDTDPYRTILSPLTLEQLGTVTAQIQAYLEGLTEEQRLQLGLDEAAFQDLLNRLSLVRSYIENLPAEKRIKIIGEVDFNLLAGLADIWARLKAGRYQGGGPVPGVGRGDIVPALLEPGEFVIPRWMMRIPWLRTLILSIWQYGQHYQEGGPVSELLRACTGKATCAASDDTNAQEIARERLRLEKELLRLQGDIEKLRELELAEIHEANRELQKQIWALEDAQRIQQERESLERRLAELQGDVARLRELELRGVQEANRGLLQQIWALEDAQKIQRERESLERRLYELQGNTAKLRELELEKIHEANRELQRQIWAFEEFQEGLRKASQLVGHIGGALAGGLVEAMASALVGDWVGAALSFLDTLIEGARDGLERLRHAQETTAQALEELAGRATELANRFLDLIFSAEYYGRLQRELARGQSLLINALLGFLAPLAFAFSLLFDLAEEVEQGAEETEETVRRSLASLNVPTGYKLERAAWGVARPGEPWQEEEEQGVRDRFRELLKEVPGWLRDIIARFRDDLQTIGEALRRFLGNLQAIWAEVAPVILEALLPVLHYFVDGLNDVLTIVENILKPALLEFAGPIISALGRALSDITVSILGGLAAFLANIALPVLQTFSQVLADLAAWVRQALLPDFLTFSEAFRRWWQGEVGPFLQSQVFPTLASWGQTLYSWIKNEFLPFLQNQVWPFLRDRLWPAIVDVVENKVIPAFERIWSIIEKYWPLIEEWLVGQVETALMDFVGKLERAAAYTLSQAGETWAALRMIWESQSLSLWDKILGTLGIVLNSFNLLSGTVLGLIGAAFGPLGAAIGFVIGGLLGLIPGFNSFLSQLVNGIVGFFGTLFSMVGQLLVRAADLIFQPIKWIVNGVIWVINSIIGAVNWALGWLGVRIPQIPYLQEGGYILREGLAYLHRGELVVPARAVPAGGVGPTIYIGEVHLHGVEDPEEFMARLEDYIRRRNLRGTGQRYGTYAIAGA